jgi:hypothetical protein
MLHNAQYSSWNSRGAMLGLRHCPGQAGITAGTPHSFSFAPARFPPYTSPARTAQYETSQQGCHSVSSQDHVRTLCALVPHAGLP